MSSTTPRARSVGIDATAGGSLDAMMLDMKRTFDEVVLAHSDAGEGRSDPGQPVLRGAVLLVLGHPGVHGHGAARPAAQPQAEADGSWDLIVVDTPPARSALDFLDAPEHLSSLLDGRFLRLLLAPARGPFRLMSVGFNLVSAAINKVLGSQIIDRCADVRHRVRGPVRRLPAARDADVRTAVVERTRPSWWWPRRARRAARGGLLRRPAHRGADAAVRRW